MRHILAIAEDEPDLRDALAEYFSAAGFEVIAAGDGAGFRAAVKDRVQVKNLHATVLQQMGLDPNHLSYFYGGLDNKLVGVEGADAIQEIVA